MKINDIYIFIATIVAGSVTISGSNYIEVLEKATGLDWWPFFAVLWISSVVLFFFSVFLAKSFLSKVRRTINRKKIILSYILVALSILLVPLMFILAALNS
jgi:hypothetical protein